MAGRELTISALQTLRLQVQLLIEGLIQHNTAVSPDQIATTKTLAALILTNYGTQNTAIQASSNFSTLP